MEKVVTDYLKLLDIPVSESYFKTRIASHPDYSSLLSVADTLEQLGIPYGAARLEKDKLGTTFPYLLHVEKGSGEYVLVKDKKDMNTQPGLLSNWSRIVLQAEAPESIDDEENRKHLSSEKAGRTAFGLFILLVFAIVDMSWIQSFSWVVVLFSVTSIAGAALGYLLVAKDLGVNYDSVESFCNAGKKVNCDQVLHSGDATLFSQFSFSDVVLSYFSSQFITAGLLIPVTGVTSPVWWALAVVGMFNLLMVVYSIWLQAFKLKSWCKLCLLVAGVLVIQAGMFGWMFVSGVFGLVDGAVVTTAIVWALFPATGSVVYLIKSHLKEGAEAKRAEAAANRIKFNPSVFFHLLLQQRQVDCTPFEQELFIGNPEAPVNITMAASLGCSSCKEGFEKALQIVVRLPESVYLSARFLMPNSEIGEESNHPGEVLLSSWLHHVYGKENQSDKTAELMKDWYSSMHFDTFREEYSYKPANGQDKTIQNMIHAHTEWFKKEGINKTPTFFVNGYSLPVHYRIEEVARLFPESPDQLSTVKNISENNQTVLIRK
ncbi:MAG: vitamin K epoxide reductase family protein [Bacteroidota bacterium]